MLSAVPLTGFSKDHIILAVQFCCMPLAVQSMVSAMTVYFFNCAVFGFGGDRVLLALVSLVSTTTTTTKPKNSMILAVQSSAETV